MAAAGVADVADTGGAEASAAGAKRPRLGTETAAPVACAGGSNGSRSRRPLHVLGVGTPTHDTGACLLRDGVVVHAVNEERFSREKLDSEFPRRCIKHILETEGLQPCDIDVVALGLFGGANAKSEQMLAVMRRLHDAPPAEAVHERLDVAHQRDVHFANLAEESLLRMGFARSQVRWYDHHLCHAYAAFYCSTFEGATVVTFDGRGDCLSGTVYEAQRSSEAAGPGGEPPGFRLLAVTTFLDSVGYLYSIVTQLLGFKPFHHEGKVTGLAAKGLSRRGQKGGTFEVLSKAVWLEEEPGTRGLNPRTGRPMWGIRTDLTGQYYKAFSTATPPRLLEELSRHTPEDIAAGIQDITEHIVCEYMQRNGFLAPQMCVAGGLFANVKLNQRLRELPGVSNVYVFPHMGDGGIHIGAAMLATAGVSVAPHPRALTGAALRPWQHVFLGPCIDAAEVDAIAAAVGGASSAISVLAVRGEGEYAARVAEHLAAGRVVGLAYGRMEFGPRALGHRSILAQATDRAINDRLNARLRRTEFMPFAPVTLRSQAERCFKGWRGDHAAARYMTMCYETTAEFAAQCPATVHVDSTARPQVLGEETELYEQIVRAYIDRTGLLALVNTSFNAHGEPIVCSAADAYRGFADQDACDVLALYPYLFTRRDAEQPVAKERACLSTPCAGGLRPAVVCGSQERPSTPECDRGHMRAFARPPSHIHAVKRTLLERGRDPKCSPLFAWRPQMCKSQVSMDVVGSRPNMPSSKHSALLGRMRC